MQRVAVIGMGLIGGSLAASLKAAGFHVTGVSRNPGSLEKALERGFVDEAGTSRADAVAEADVVFIATPVGSIVDIVREICASAGPGAIISDVGSTKAKIVAAIEEFIPQHVHFIGGHPMAGSEREGIDAASPGLFAGSLYVLTPTAKTTLEAFETLHSVLLKTGANVIAVDPVKHDEITALISHLPHLVSAALMNLAAKEAGEKENLLLLAAGGFRDTTRIAAGNPGMWLEICMANAEAILNAISKFKVELERYAEAIKAADETSLMVQLEEARAARVGLPSLMDKKRREFYSLYVPVVDKPGVISDITLAIGELGVNIEDIEILHASEQAGTLRLAVQGKEDADRVAARLRSKGHEVSVEPIGG